MSHAGPGAAAGKWKPTRRWGCLAPAILILAFCMLAAVGGWITQNLATAGLVAIIAIFSIAGVFAVRWIRDRRIHR